MILDNAKRRGILVADRCYSCHQEELDNHSFIYCKKVKRRGIAVADRSYLCHWEELVNHLFLHCENVRILSTYAFVCRDELSN